MKKLAYENAYVNRSWGWVVFENAHEPIIAKELWELAQARTKQVKLQIRCSPIWMISKIY